MSTNAIQSMEDVNINVSILMVVALAHVMKDTKSLMRSSVLVS